MSRTFRSLFRVVDERTLRNILDERRKIQIQRERASLVKRMPPGVVLLRGRLVDQ